jgi:D-arabinose 1-dehydrogenase-like Zn-dependent alcohol dehydrogenase
VDAVGEGVTTWKRGDRAGVGWHGGHCFVCGPCRNGDFKNCRSAVNCGVHYDGGFAEYLVAPEEAVVRIPDVLSPVEAAPLLCAGVTTFNALRNSGARTGDLVAVQGIGGLGHLGVQFAKKLGFRTAAISQGADKAELAKKLGADLYIDTKAGNAAEQLQQHGGAKAILATAPHGSSIAALVDGLGVEGRILVIAVTVDPISVSGIQLLTNGRSIQGWLAGAPHDIQDTLDFAAAQGVRPMTEVYPLAKAAEGFERMLSNQARFRVVLTP